MAKKPSKADSGDGKSQTEGPPPGGAAPYVVLARKYRPTTFDDLIGQDAMVTTLKNAFASDRIAQGFMLTGVRGVGKTTTARILSRALNYEREGVDKPTFDMPEFGRHCVEIMEGRHPDVLEMDAASNTGVDNIREIIESARYRPLVARYKVYLIDEVHMLSKGAFNALLKTLEEPPGHVKFIFATTEVRKVPVTVLSRCQRFDLRRVDVPVLMAHFKKIVAKEGGEAEDDALALIARAAEGSVRDGLSLLDQALAMSSGSVSAVQVRAMLGLADRGRIFDLLEKLFGGSAGEALEQFARLYGDGAEPQQVLADLAEAVHVTTRAKTLGVEAAGEGLSLEEKRRAAALGGRLSMAILSRAWQMLVKGLEDAANAPNPAAAAEMVLIRLAYTADLPPPDEIIKTLGGDAVGVRTGKPVAPPEKRVAAATPVDVSDADSSDESDFSDEDDVPQDYAPAALPAVRSFAEVVELASARREAKLKVHLEEHVSLVKFDPAGSIELHLLAGAPKELANELREKLNAWTGKRWMVALSKAPGERTIGDMQRQRAAAEIEDMQRHPAVAAVLQQFPDAEITSVRQLPKIDKDDTGTG
ncbi:MAG TPA: DNA polymerase III subunit gamma/tau [Hyphomicrobiaceae bacterium]|nr:DNA polymerase III subunit gamma/tau [Hyphomicrobiaceae bacterium]